MLGSFLCLIMANETVLVLLTILSIFFAATTASMITVLNDGNRTDCSSNSSGTFCYSLSLALNHTVTDNTAVFIASPEVCVSDFTTVDSVNNISIYGRGVGKTVICYHEGITFKNSRNIKLANLTIQLCPTEKSACNIKFKTSSTHELCLYFFNCANVSIHQVNVSSLQGGLAMYNPTGHIDISYSTFERNNSSREGGGVAVFTNYTNFTNITFYACVFDANRNSYKKSKFRSNSGHGGGLLLLFVYAYKTHTRILNCNFTKNVAAWGGGLFVGYKLDAKDNFLFIRNTTFAYNEAKFHGGGGIDIGLYELENQVNNNTILIENATFLSNSAEYGGGTTIFSDTEIRNHKINHVIFSDCRWENNSAQFSTAVDVSPNVYDNTVGYFPIIITFENCEFTGNKLTGKRNSVTYSGTVMITALTVHFRETTIFKKNLGSALCVVAANVVFKSSSNVTFDGNHGNSGGALALLGMATMQFSSHSIFLFQNNEATFVGGAIYWHSIDQHDFFSTHTCFLNNQDINSTNVSFVFNNNSAHSGFGHSIYASTLRPCGHSCRNTSIDQVGDIFNLTCIANFTFDNSNKQANIATSVSEILLDLTNLSTNDTLMATPGIVLQLNASAFDENHNDVTSIAVFQNSIVSEESMPPIKLAAAYKHSSLSDIRLFGTPHSTGSLLVQANRVEGISTVIDVEMVECPPGFVLSGEACECSDNEYYGIGCIDSHAYIIYEGYWAGYLMEDNTTMANPANLWTAPCALTYCNYTLHVSEWGDFKDKFFLLPEMASALMLDEAICNANRTGRICGQCKPNFSVFFKSKEYTCYPETYLCDFGILLFILSELVPLVIFFVTVLFSNISFTSGAVNGFILFAQIIDLLYIDSHKFVTTKNTNFSLLVSTYQVIYGFFNLDFFSIEKLSFCLWRGATVLDILVFKYITTVSAILLIVCLVLLMRYCSCWYRCKRCTRQRLNVSMIHGLSAFLVMAYSQSTRVTFDILQPAMLKSGGNSTNLSTQYAVWLNGSMEYFSWQHAYYAVPALIFLVVIVILPPSILLINPLLIKFVALFQSRGYCSTSCSQYWLNKLLLVRLKPLFDHFQGCFKDNCRWVAGIYFLYRLVILFLHVASPNLSSFYIFTEFFLAIFVIFHSTVQPYQKRWHNILDILIFGNLAIINGLSMFMYFWSSHIDLPVSKHFAWLVQLFLIYCPIFYIVLYTTVTWFRKYRGKRSSSFNEHSLENELPSRLLMSKSDSYRSF